MEIVGQERTRELRRSVLRPLTGPGDPLPGDDQSDAVHLAALDDADRVLSTCFVFPDPWPLPLPGGDIYGNAWHLRQMATEPLARGRGAGSAVVEAVITHVAALGADLVWCHAREEAFGFYGRHGFTAVGALHGSGQPPIPHKYMYRPVLAVPTAM